MNWRGMHALGGLMSQPWNLERSHCSKPRRTHNTERTAHDVYVAYIAFPGQTRVPDRWRAVEQ